MFRPASIIKGGNTCLMLKKKKKLILTLLSYMLNKRALYGESCCYTALMMLQIRTNINQRYYSQSCWHNMNQSLLHSSIRMHCVISPCLDVLGSASLGAFLLQSVHHRLQRTLHRRFGRLSLAAFLLQLRAEALGQRVAALPRQRSQILL